MTDLPATYTAAEVKVLTETAGKVAYALGRKDAAEEIAAAILATTTHYSDWQQRDVVYDMERLACRIASRPDATSGRTDPGDPNA